MLSALLGLLGTIVYGGSDFFGGLAAGRMRAERVTAITSTVGLVLLAVAALFFGADFSAGALLWGLLAGVAGTAALVLLYGCLALGPMSILAPIMGLVSAVVPVTLAFLRGERLSTQGYLGLALGLVAVIMICFVPGRAVVRPSVKAIAMAVGAGLAVGMYLFFIDLSPADSGMAPLIIVFIVSAGITWLAVLLRRAAGARSAPAEGVARWRSGTALAVYAGVTDAAASILFLAALRAGDLSVVSVLSALSPGGTILLAALLLRERVAAVQWTGLAIALAAAALLALA
ncbi:hypothetical protein BH11ACT4_BH11ACT4_06170 [soil metagenome]